MAGYLWTFKLIIYKVLTYDFDLINRHIYTKSTNLLQPWNTYLVYFLPIDSITARISDVSKEHRKERMFDGQISRCDNACVMQCDVAGWIVRVCVLFKLPDLPYRALVPPRPPCVGTLLVSPWSCLLPMLPPPPSTIPSPSSVQRSTHPVNTATQQPQPTQHHQCLICNCVVFISDIYIFWLIWLSISTN